MSIGFKLDAWLCVIIVSFLQLWPSAGMQAAVGEQTQHGYVAGWVKVAPW